MGCNTLALFSFLPELLKHFRENYPEIKLDIEELPSKSIISKLISAEIDVEFPFMPISHPLLEIKSIRREHMKLAVLHSHPYANQGTVPLGVFANETFIVHSHQENPAIYEAIIHCCEVAGFKPILKEKKSDQSCIGLVTTGIGVHFVSPQIKCLALNDITYIDIEPSPSLEMAVAYRKGDECHYLTPFKALRLE